MLISTAFEATSYLFGKPLVKGSARRFSSSLLKSSMFCFKASSSMAISIMAKAWAVSIAVIVISMVEKRAIGNIANPHVVASDNLDKNFSGKYLAALWNGVNLRGIVFASSAALVFSSPCGCRLSEISLWHFWQCEEVCQFSCPQYGQ